MGCVRSWEKTVRGLMAVCLLLKQNFKNSLYCDFPCTFTGWCLFDGLVLRFWGKGCSLSLADWETEIIKAVGLERQKAGQEVDLRQKQGPASHLRGVLEGSSGKQLGDVAQQWPPEHKTASPAPTASSGLSGAGSHGCSISGSREAGLHGCPSSCQVVGWSRAQGVQEQGGWLVLFRC